MKKKQRGDQMERTSKRGMIISEADKSETTFRWSVDELNNEEFYHELPTDP